MTVNAAGFYAVVIGTTLVVGPLMYGVGRYGLLGLLERFADALSPVPDESVRRHPSGYPLSHVRRHEVHR